MRSMRTHMAWNVHTHMPRMLLPSRRRSRRSFISRAALLVKVMARICQGMMPRSSSMWAMRYVSTRVLPEPAPASTSSGPSTLSTALFCAGLSESMSIVMKQPSCVADGNVGRTSFWRVSLPSPRTAFRPSAPCAHDPYTFDVHCIPECKWLKRALELTDWHERPQRRIIELGFNGYGCVRPSDVHARREARRTRRGKQRLPVEVR